MGLHPRRVTGVLVCLVGLALLPLASQEPAQPTAPAAEPSDGRVVLEFDAPPEFMERDRSGSYRVHGLRIGYFSVGGEVPLWTVEVARTDVTLSGPVARVSLPAQAYPEHLKTVVVRVQTLSGRTASAWSAPSPPFEPPPLPVASHSARKARSPRIAKTRPTLAPAALAEHPALKELFEATVAEAAREQTLSRFRNANELAVALVISKQHDLPFPRLLETLQGPPTRSLRQAVAQLKPNVNPKRAVASARLEAQRLVRPSSHQRQ